MPNFLVTMEIDPYGRCPCWTHPMSNAMAFIHSLLVNSFFFISMNPPPHQCPWPLVTWKAFVWYCQVLVEITLSNIYCIRKYVCFVIVYRMIPLGSLGVVRLKSYGSPYHFFLLNPGPRCTKKIIGVLLWSNS